MGVLDAVEALADRAGPDVGGEWDPAWHLGPIEDPAAAERERQRAWLEEHAGELEWLWERLHDDASRAVLAAVLAHRLAGSRRVAFGVPRTTSERLTRFAEAELTCRDPEPALPGLPCYDLAAIGLDLRLAAVAQSLVQTFLLEQYRHPAIAAANVRPGDTAVDGGAFWGDTALWLAARCGPAGRVVAFEPDPANRAVLDANLRVNTRAGAPIDVRPEALWHERAELALHQAGGASVVGGEGGATEVPAVALDDLVAGGALDAVDFLKLDVEGAEQAVLRGARQVLATQRPRLALAAYHRPEDLLALPRLIDDAAPGYRLALSHRSPHHLDTVLFAWPGDADGDC